MNSDVTVDRALIEWLLRVDHGPMAGWAPDLPAAELRCDAGLVARLSEIARSVRGTTRVFVAGCPVVHHPSGRPIAAAAGPSWLVVRSGQPAGALAAPDCAAATLGPEWVALDPFPGDIAFARGLDLLRGHMARAFERAAPP